MDLLARCVCPTNAETEIGAIMKVAQLYSFISVHQKSELDSLNGIIEAQSNKQ